MLAFCIFPSAQNTKSMSSNLRASKTSLTFSQSSQQFSTAARMMHFLTPELRYCLLKDFLLGWTFGFSSFEWIVRQTLKKFRPESTPEVIKITFLWKLIKLFNLYQNLPTFVITFSSRYLSINKKNFNPSTSEQIRASTLMVFLINFCFETGLVSSGSRS